MPLRGPVRSIYSVPTIVIFCEGLGIATARALIEAEPSVGSLNFPLRQSVRLYYRVSAWELATQGMPESCVRLAVSCQVAGVAGVVTLPVARLSRRVRHLLACLWLRAPYSSCRADGPSGMPTQTRAHLRQMHELLAGRDAILQDFS